MDLKPSMGPQPLRTSKLLRRPKQTVLGGQTEGSVSPRRPEAPKEGLKEGPKRA